ncbi:prolyl oligopeptidase family serine peptidase [Luteimonas arsenica]|uniref:prolyl oligopeptidase family serine peptidase n=1 Tax=Luteimonas arsenica TaxID=1586242 RepID=UPI001054AE61|nr:prolyl oligopeptidase family serine peptidase [Luteimonas arsenica]
MATHALKHFAAPLLFALLCAHPFAQAADAPATQASADAPSGYRLPAAGLRAIVDAPTAPRLSLSPRRDLLAYMQQPALPGIDVVAQPELKLAGLRIHPRTHSASAFSFSTDLWLQAVDGGEERRIEGLPQPLALSSLQWSPDQRHIAFSHVDARAGRVELWLVDVAGGRARRLLEQALGSVTGSGFDWLPDSSGLIALLRPEGQGAAPADDGVPVGPNIQETEGSGQVQSLRTYQDLLKNAHDEALFAYYMTSQLVRVGVDGRVRAIGVPELYVGASVSPDGGHLLRQRLERPFSYAVPYSRFPRRIDVIDLDGRLLHTVATLPLVEGLPTGNDAVATGVRRVSWRADAPATLVWAEAQDGGDPAREVEVRDRVFAHAAPFRGEPEAIADLSMRYGGIQWGHGSLALLSEYWWKTRQLREWRLSPDTGTAPALLREGSYEDRYADPGDPVMQLDERGFARLLTTGDGETIYRIGDGASPEGDRPFLDRQDLAGGGTERLFHSQAPWYEAPIALLDADASRILTLRESPTEPANVLLRTPGAADAEPVALTDFPHPTPELRGVSKEQIRYTRDDGIELTADLYLPAGYDAERDGPLPMLMWAYPREFKSADAASQVRGSPHRFNRISYWGPLAYLARGYAVLDGPTMPIVGEGDAEPNDSYVKQLVASAQAAVDEVVERGVADRDRIAIGGHSYGAFMTANLLAHSDLFRAGIARSGAYNRSLTPFGFQAEERNYWQATDTYQAMSPFVHAGKINEPLLIIHGEEDNNSGTFPMQSERLFAAMKGLGGTARLVMLPNESHGYRARESILHMLAETDAWLEKHVKETPRHP